MSNSSEAAGAVRVSSPATVLVCGQDGEPVVVVVTIGAKNLLRRLADVALALECPHGCRDTRALISKIETDVNTGTILVHSLVTADRQPEQVQSDLLALIPAEEGSDGLLTVRTDRTSVRLAVGELVSGVLGQLAGGKLDVSGLNNAAWKALRILSPEAEARALAAADNRTAAR